MNSTVYIHLPLSQCTVAMTMKYFLLITFAEIWAIFLAAVNWFPLGIGWLAILQVAVLLSYPVRVAITDEEIPARYTSWPDWFIQQAIINAAVLAVIIVAYALDAVAVQYFPEAKQSPINIGKVTTGWFYAYYFTRFLIDLNCMGTPMPGYLIIFLRAVQRILERAIHVPEIREVHVDSASISAKAVDVHVQANEIKLPESAKPDETKKNSAE